jgi:uncharacterized protein
MISAAANRVLNARAIRAPGIHSPLLAHVIRIACVFAASIASVAVAQQPFTVPAYVGFVNDFANVIPDSSRSSLEALSERVKAATRGEIVVVTLKNLGGRAQEDVAREIGRQWKVGAQAAVGDKARNSGVIILVVPKETSSDGRGACRIEVGNGAEGFLTDATTGDLCREAIPLFQQRQYGSAIALIETRIAGLYAREFNVSLDGVPPPPAPDGRVQQDGGGGRSSLIVAVVIVLVILSILRRGGGGGGGGILNLLFFFLGASSNSGGRGRGGWGGGGGFGGGGGGGFGGFGGGGGFSGGGGGSNW